MVKEDKLTNSISKIVENILSINDIDVLCNYSKNITDIDIIIDGCDITSNKIAFLKNFLCKILIKKQKELFSKQNVTSTSLNNVLSKYLMNGKNLQDFFNRCRCKNRNIGNIPKIFLDKVKDKKNTVIAIYNLFAEYSFRLNYDYELDYDDCDYEINYLSPDIKAFEECLSALINKPVKMSYVGSGFNGNGFKIVVDEQKFFYKVFYLYNSTDPKRYYNHGGLAEPQMALFATKNSPKSNFAKFFFGRVCNVMGIDSFLVTEFIERNDNIKNDKIKLSVDYVKISETEEHKYDNKINGKIVDFGGIRVAIPQLADKNLRKLVRVILSFIKYKNDENKLYYEWNISNIKALKTYLAKFKKSDYQKALELIENYQNYVVSEIFDFLKDIEKYKDDVFHYEKFIRTTDVLKINVADVYKTITIYNLHVATRTEPIPEFNSFGNFIVRLNSLYQIVYLFNLNDEIIKIRIEKFENNNIKTVLEVDNIDNVKNFNDVELYKIFNL